MSRQEAMRLQRALVAVYPLYIQRKVEPYGVDVNPAAVTAGQAWLASELEALLSLPFAEQARGPLEVFQEATGFISRALASQNVPLPSRDSGDHRALPGDHYGLAPVSSRELGRTVWEAHLRWGAAKAADATQP